jgi:hypothetical protein
MGRPLKISKLSDVGVYYCDATGNTSSSGPSGQFWKIAKQESDLIFALTDGVITVRATLTPVIASSLTKGQMSIYGQNNLGTEVYVAKISDHLATSSNNVVYQWFTSKDVSQPTTAINQLWLESIEYFC